METRVHPGLRRLLLGLWIGVAIQVVGQIVDVSWHAAHGSHFAAPPSRCRRTG